MPPGTIKRVVWLSGVADVAEHYRFEASRSAQLPLLGAVAGVERLSPMAPATGGPRGWHLASPLAVVRSPPPRVAGRMPPVTLVHGRADSVVPWEGSARLARAASERGVGVRVHFLPDLDHSDTLLPLMHPGFERPGRNVRRLLLDLISEPSGPGSRL